VPIFAHEISRTSRLDQEICAGHSPVDPVTVTSFGLRDVARRHPKLARPKRKELEHTMRKLVIVASLIAVGGIAAAASADQGASKARYHTMNGRTLVWHAPQAEQPYALRGQAAVKAKQPRVEIRQHGRAGNTVEVRPESAR
jgi:hypothetical protein